VLPEPRRRTRATGLRSNGDKVAGAKRAAVKRGRGAPAEEGRVGGGHGEGEGIVMRPGDRSHDRPGQGRAPRRVPKREQHTHRVHARVPLVDRPSRRLPFRRRVRFAFPSPLARSMLRHDVFPLLARRFPSCSRNRRFRESNHRGDDRSRFGRLIVAPLSLSLSLSLS